MLQLLWHFGEIVLRQDLFRQPLRAATFPKGEGMALPRQCVKLQFEQGNESSGAQWCGDYRPSSSRIGCGPCPPTQNTSCTSTI